MPLEFDASEIDRITDEFAAKAGQLESLVGSEQMKTKVKHVLRPLTDDAKARIHSLTGHLRDGIETRVETHIDEPTYIEVGISYKRHRKSRHAHLVEGGHGGPRPAKPHPFWEPAVEAHYDEATQALEETVMDIIDVAVI